MVIHLNLHLLLLSLSQMRGAKFLMNEGLKRRKLDFGFLSSCNHLSHPLFFFISTCCYSVSLLFSLLIPSLISDPSKWTSKDSEDDMLKETARAEGGGTSRRSQEGKVFEQF